MVSAETFNNQKRFSKYFLVLAILVLSWVQLQVSCICHAPSELFYTDIRYIILNIAAESILFTFLLLILGSLWRSCAVFSGVSTLLSIVNRCTVLWHDSPLTFADLKNWKVAANVLNNYHLNLFAISGLLIIFAAEGFVTYRLKQFPRNPNITWKKRIIAAWYWCFAAFGIVFFGYFSPWPLMPQENEFSWIRDYQKYGYVNCTIRAARQTYHVANMLVKPNQYDLLDIDSLQIKEDMPADHAHETPDIILILNETFYDLSLLVNLQTDVPYMENIESLDNTIRGYAVNPAGGTNPSEYELLTSNSMKPMHGLYPFVALNMDNANSIVSHLKALGYTATGAHCAQPENYNRGRAYTALGFDHIYFDDDFTQQEYYGNRRLATDSSIYKSLLSWYQSSDESAPQFFYLLTIQNHGGWQRNEAEWDIVHAQGDFGEYGEEINEYLSCVYLSDQAFKELTDQLKKIDRRVIVCMVGDHGPSLTGQIVSNPTEPEPLRLRTSVPFVIWANYPLSDELHLDGNVMSMNYLLPALLKTAKVPLSPYYQQMINLKEDVPILTAYSGYYDKDDVLHEYGESGEYTEGIRLYQCLEYNNLQQKRNQSLFDPYHVEG